MPKVVAEGVLAMDTEDGGMAMVGELEVPDSQLFFRVQSWDVDFHLHQDVRPYIGRRVRITMEVVE